MYIEPPKCLVISPWGLDESYGGPRILMNRLFEALHRRHSLIVDVAGPTGDSARPGWVGQSFEAGTRQGMQSPAQQLRWAASVTQILAARASAYDFVHFQSAYAANLLGTLLPSFKTPYVVLPVLESGDLRSDRASWSSKLLSPTVRYTVRRANHVFALSRGIAREASDLGVDVERISIIGNPVDTRTYRPPLTRRNASPASTRIGLVGKLGHQKRPALLLEALNKGGPRLAQATLVLVGPWESETYKASFYEAAQRLGLSERVKHIPYASNVHEIMRDEMDVFALPSRAEGLPGALTEAMSTGLPCVVTDVGAMGSVVRDAGAGLVVDANPLELATALTSVTAEDQYQAFAEAARVYAERHFSVEHVADEYWRRVASLIHKSETKAERNQ